MTGRDAIWILLIGALLGAHLGFTTGYLMGLDHGKHEAKVLEGGK